jgi:hypothetical protein
MNKSPHLLLFFAPSMAVLACGVLGSSATEGPVDKVGSTQIEVDGSNGTFLSGLPAEMKATFGTAPTIEVGFMAESGAGWITFDTHLSMADVSTGTAILSLTTSPLDVDLATVQLGNVNGAPDFGTGTVQLQISAQATTGTITSASSSSPWTFAGTMDVECWVPESEVGPQPGGGTNSTDGSEVLLADMNFTTPECAPFRALAGN